jgi:cysteine desulfurase / selenocysteine lyase
MKRREFFGKTGTGIAGVFASRLGLSSIKLDKFSNLNSPGTLLDLKTIRKDFPPLKKITYLDTAFVGLMSHQVKKAHEDFLEERLQFGPFSKDKSILGIWMDKMEDVRSQVATFLGAKNEEVSFNLCTGCGSNTALNGINWQKGDNAVIDDLEYPTDFHILNSLKKKDVEIRIARNENGTVSPEKFEALVDKRTRAIVVSHVSYLNGFRHDLKKLADIVHAYDGYLIVDAAQSIGGIKVNVKDEDVDFMSGIPYKWLNGPNGVGFLYVRENLIESHSPDRLGWASTHDFKSLKTMESNELPKNASRFEYGTLAFESIYALESALDYIDQIGIETIEKHNLQLTQKLRKLLVDRNVEFFTPENNQSPVLSFYMENEKPFGKKMKEKNIYITARRWGKGQVRVSPHFYNNEEDIDKFIHAFDAVRKS